jgi:hypothetical protein
MFCRDSAVNKQLAAYRILTWLCRSFSRCNWLTWGLSTAERFALVFSESDATPLGRFFQQCNVRYKKLAILFLGP